MELEIDTSIGTDDLPWSQL